MTRHIATTGDLSTLSEFCPDGRLYMLDLHTSAW